MSVESVQLVCYLRGSLEDFGSRTTPFHTADADLLLAEIPWAFDMTANHVYKIYYLQVTVNFCT